MTASTNIRMGPTSQFWISDRVSTLRFLKTSPSSSYFTLAKGGYIIRIRPMAMGILDVPTWKLLMKDSTDGNNAPSATPTAIARKIHNVRYRSNVDRRLVTLPVGVALIDT